MREKNNFIQRKCERYVVCEKVKKKLNFDNEEAILGIPAYFVKRSKMKKKKERRDFCIQKKG